METIVNSLESDYKKVKQENDDLKKELTSIRTDYESMVETVKKLETDTMSWREIIEWPSIEMPFEPDNASLIILHEPSFPGKQKVVFQSDIVL